MKSKIKLIWKHYKGPGNYWHHYCLAWNISEIYGTCTGVAGIVINRRFYGITMSEVHYD